MLPSFSSELAACVPTSVQAQLVALEADNMAGFERNGAPFDDYFKRWDLTVHIATASDGALMGFAISGAEGRGVVFVYELHVAKPARKRGVARSLLDLVERSSLSRGRSRPTPDGRAQRAPRQRRSRLLRARGLRTDGRAERRGCDCDAPQALGPPGRADS